MLPSQEAVADVPVVLVGNKTDQWGDRMVTVEDGHRRSKEIGCVCFHEISVREDFEQVMQTPAEVRVGQPQRVAAYLLGARRVRIPL